MSLQVYIEGGCDQWEALCFNYDIAVTAPSLKAVKADLLAAVADYLHYVGELPAEEQAGLLNRRAPMLQVLKCRFAAWRFERSRRRARRSPTPEAPVHVKSVIPLPMSA